MKKRTSHAGSRPAIPNSGHTSHPPAAKPASVELRRSGKADMAWAAITYLVATLTLAHQALLGRFLVTPVSDQYIGGFPVREFAAAWERAGKGVPLWNPYIFGGMPYVASMNGDMFYPTALLRVLLPTDVGMTWGMVIHVFLAGFFMYCFLRAAHLDFMPALIGGLAYMLAGNIAGLVSPGHDGKLFVAALLPLVLLLLHRGVRDGRAWAWPVLSVVVLLAVLSPHPQALQYFLLVAGAYALFIAFSPSELGDRLPGRTVAKRLALATGAVALGMLGGAIQYLPLLEYTPWSPRAGGKGWEHAVSYSMPPEEMVNFYLPQFSGILQRYWGRNGIHLHSEYLGAAVLVLLGLAFTGHADRARRRFVWFWTGALVVSTLWALGGFTPFFHIVYALVPGTKYFRAPSVMLFVVSFCVALLAAVGAERALKGRVSTRYGIVWLGVGLAIALLASTGGLTNLAMSLADPRMADRVEPNQSDLVVGAWRSFVVVAAIVALLLARTRGALTASKAGWAIAVVIALDLWSVERLYWRFSPSASTLYASDPAIEYLKKLPQPGRVVPIASAALTSTIRDPYLGHGDGQADGLMVHRVRSVVGYHGNELGRYEELTGWQIDWPDRLGNANLRRLTNLRYLYTNSAQAPMEGLRLVVGPVRNVAGNTIYLYELPDESPAAWLVPIAVKAPDADVLPTLLNPGFDVRRAALFAPDANVPTLPIPPALPEQLNIGVRVERWDPGHIALTLDQPAPANAALVVSENYYPGWHAAVDGKPAPIGRADYVLMGVTLPTGARSVELTFTSAAYTKGKTITLLCLAVAVVWLIIGVITERRAKLEAETGDGVV